MRYLAPLATAAVFLCAQTSTAQAQPAPPESWEVFTTANSDLPNNRVFEIAVDDFGRPWLACDGLTLYDNGTWKNFDVTVLEIAIDNNNTAWCASDLFGGALTHCDGSTVISYNQDNSDIPSNWVTGVTVDNNNTVWAACAFTGVGAFDGENWTTHLGQDIGGGYLRMTHERDNTIWMAAQTTLYRYRNGDWTPIAVPDMDILQEHLTDVVSTDDGTIWAGTNSKGVVRFADGEWTWYTAADEALPSDAVLSVAVDSSGTLWVGTDAGLASYDGAVWTTYTQSNWVLPDNRVNAVAVAPDNSLWIGTGDGLLHVVQSSTDIRENVSGVGTLIVAPNPAVGPVTVSFSTTAPAYTEVALYDCTGARAAVAASGLIPAGDHRYTVDTHLAAGAYHCVVQVDGRIVARQLLIVR